MAFVCEALDVAEILYFQTEFTFLFQYYYCCALSGSELARTISVTADITSGLTACWVAGC